MEQTNRQQKRISEIEQTIKILKNTQLSDYHAQRVAEHTSQKDPRDFHERKVVPVMETREGIEIGSIHCIAGNEQIQWKDNVLFTFGAGPDTEEEAKKSFYLNKKRAIDSLRNRKTRIERGEGFA